jgi:hypothetical protein
MKSELRKVALEQYRERKVEAGIYAVRCTASADCWVGRAPDLSTIRNRVWFTLRHGSHTDRALQAAWNAHGADAFAFEIVETLEPEESRALRDIELKKRLAHWREEFDASSI